MPGASTSLFVLARDPAGAKTRLARALDPAARAGLAVAMLEDVLDAAASVPFARRVVVTESERVRDVAVAAGFEPLLVAISDTNGAATTALRAAAEARDPRALVLAADLPLLAQADLQALLAAAGEADVVIAPDRLGRGTNALVLTPPLAIAPAFGVASARAHRESAERTGLVWCEVVRPGLAHDVDEPEDLEALADAPALGAHTRAALHLTARSRLGTR